MRQLGVDPFNGHGWEKMIRGYADSKRRNAGYMNAHLTNADRAKAHVRAFHEALDDARDNDSIAACLAQYTSADWLGAACIRFMSRLGPLMSVVFLAPLKQSSTALHRRPDVFFAGANDVDGGESLWVCEMGHLLGGFDRDWIDIPATGRMCFLRYAEFHKFDGETIVESAFFMDILGVMKEAGVYPLPPMTGASFVQPGPRTHDGLLYEAQAADETAKTIELVNRMITDLDALNKAVTIRRALIIWHVAGMKICFGLARPALEPALPLKDIRNSINYLSARIWATRFITGTLPVLPKVIISAFLDGLI